MRLNLALVLSVLTVLLSWAVASEDTVHTHHGTVKGIVADKYRLFLGVPYAKPPVGPRRWQPPVPTSWSTPFDATSEPLACMQDCMQPPHVCPINLSEDCLTLSIWTPRLVNITEPLPVLVFLHGGNFRDGGGAGLEGGLLYDSTNFAHDTRVIVVHVNYRLGSFGFLYGGSGSNLLGNYGLMDQELALQWVQGNIDKFGGDPNLVTLSGQSAGAMSVAAHLTRPGTPRFQRALLQSDPFSLPFRSAQTGERLTRVVAKHAGCSNEELTTPMSEVEDCLRDLPAEDLLTAQVEAQMDLAAAEGEIITVFMPYTPVFGTHDGYLPEHPSTRFKRGEIHDMPIMLGTTTDEAEVFIYKAFGKPVNKDMFYVVLGLILGLEKIGNVADQYPLPSPPPNDTRPIISDIGNDVIFQCANRNVTNSLAQSNRQHPIYVYQYDYLMTFSENMWGPDFKMCWDHICHGADLVAFFHPNFPALGTDYTPEEDELSAYKQNYMANFFRTGNPNNGRPVPLHWPEYTDSDRAKLHMDLPNFHVSYDENQIECEFWDNIGYLVD